MTDKKNGTTALSQNSVTGLVKRTRSRNHIYGFLSLVYRCEPSRDLLQNFRDPIFLEQLGDLGVSFDKSFETSQLSVLVEELAVEYTLLFLGPGGHIYPYESAYLNEGESSWIKSATGIKRLIESLGFSYRKEYTSHHDHIAVELEVMEKVTAAEVIALEKNDIKKAREIIEFEKKFITEHLAKWIPVFADKVIDRAQSSFYRGMAELTKEFVLLEAIELQKISL